jgi:hypothetical protein
VCASFFVLFAIRRCKTQCGRLTHEAQWVQVMATLPYSGCATRGALLPGPLQGWCTTGRLWPPFFSPGPLSAPRPLWGPSSPRECGRVAAAIHLLQLCWVPACYCRTPHFIEILKKSSYKLNCPFTHETYGAVDPEWHVPDQDPDPDIFKVILDPATDPTQKQNRERK